MRHLDEKKRITRETIREKLQSNLKRMIVGRLVAIGMELVLCLVAYFGARIILGELRGFNVAIPIIFGIWGMYLIVMLICGVCKVIKRGMAIRQGRFSIVEDTLARIQHERVNKKKIHLIFFPVFFRRAYLVESFWYEITETVYCFTSGCEYAVPSFSSNEAAVVADMEYSLSGEVYYTVVFDHQKDKAVLIYNTKSYYYPESTERSS